MIKDHCFTEEWLVSFKKQAQHKRIDKIILEKMIYALHLLERLKANGLKFVFKGGTSLVLLLEEGNRFSIDIDIICKTSREQLEKILQNIVTSSRFTSFRLDDHRSYKAGVPKAHYSFHFDSATQGKYPGTILLDILIEDSIYPEEIESKIQTKWIETEKDTFVTTPSIDAITGDKLTAFAPNTIGIPYFKGKDKQSFAMEICKQLFDLSKLFEKIRRIEMVSQSFHAFAIQEIEYRKAEMGKSKLTPEIVLKDTIETCRIITSRGKGDPEKQVTFAELQKGITAFGTGFLMTGTFRIDNAISAAAIIAYLAAKILKNDYKEIEFFREQEVRDLQIDAPEWIFLNKLKRQPDKSAFYYWYQAVQLL